MKFGGAALERPFDVVARIRAHLRSGEKVVVVASARAGVTDRLVRALHAPRTDASNLGRWLRRRHPNGGPSVDRELARLVRALARRPNAARDTAARSDAVLACGERIAVAWLVVALRDAGVRATAFDAARLGLWTDGRHGRGAIDLERSRSRVGPRLRASLARSEVPVVTGFFGRGPRGEDVTLGRGGSDYSASALGALVGARYVELVKCDASVLSADPRIVRAARPVRRLSYSEAEELAESGARVLHPLSIEPARRANLELRVVSLRKPRGERTVIGAADGRPGVRAISVTPELRLWRLRFPGARGRAGVLAEVGGRLARSGVPVLQAFTSAAVVSVVVGPEWTERARRALESLVRERSARLGGPDRVALVALVGRGAPRKLRNVSPEILGSARGISATRSSVTLALPAPTARASARSLHERLIGGRPERFSSRKGPRSGHAPTGIPVRGSQGRS